MSDAPRVEVVDAAAADQPAVARLMQLYTHDFSEFWAGLPRGEIGDDGLFPDYPDLDRFWSDPECGALLIRVDGHLAGFALLNREAHSGRPADRNMAEFFVLRKHRGAGVGRQAAHVLFRRYPGQWELAVARRNRPALAFWTRAVETWPTASGLEVIDLDQPDWNGPVLRFTST